MKKKLVYVPYGEDWENEIMKMKKRILCKCCGAFVKGVTNLKNFILTYLIRTRKMKKQTRQKKFKCEYAREVRENKGYTMNCFYFGCIHQIWGDCPIIKGGEK